MGSEDFVTSELMLMLLYLAAKRLQDVYHGYECVTDPRLYKADHCCLSLSRAIACCAVF